VQPPASFRALADPIYEAFYGLTDQPFAITTDPKFFFLSSSHQRAYSDVLNGLRRREGIILVTGDTGTGKTTLCRAVLESLGSRTFSSLILNPYLTGAEILRIVLRDFGLVSPDDVRRGRLASADIAQLMEALEGFLRSLVKLDSHAVIVLDEAQSLAPDVLDQVRLLTALEHDNRRLVGIVLCGQPNLLATLAGGPLRALNERITRRVALEPIATAEVEAYIQHRLAIVGGTKSVGFGPDAAGVVAELSAGLPRRINVLCDRALQEGRVDGVNAITSDLVRRAAKSLGMDHTAAAEPRAEPASDRAPALVLGQLAEPARPRRWIVAATAALIVLLVALVALAFGAYVEARLTRAGVLAIAPPPAAAPARPPALALPVPPDEEFLRLLTPRRVAPPPPPPSSELPDNPNQLN
jgi:general secretion pathway protein A